MELYEEYPDELAQLLKYLDDKLVLYTEHAVQRAQKPKLIWGLRSIKYADQ